MEQKKKNKGDPHNTGNEEKGLDECKKLERVKKREEPEDLHKARSDGNLKGRRAGTVEEEKCRSPRREQGEEQDKDHEK